MAAVKLLDFKDIQDSVLEQLKIPATDTTTLGRVKRDINKIYVNEVAPFQRWPWLVKELEIRHLAADNADGALTASVTKGSRTVTLSGSLATSKVRFFFATDSFSEIYSISGHPAATPNIVLATEYTGETASTANFKIWVETLNLPIDCRETIDVWHDFRARMMVPTGQQKFDERRKVDQRSQELPLYYTTGDFFDPDMIPPETESNRVRQVRIFPALRQDDITIHVKYIQEVDALDVDGDEPVMPIEDRIVLVYGALREAWLRDRNESAAALNDSLFKDKLAKMAARYEDSTEQPRLEVDDRYMRLRRRSRRRFEVS